MQYQITNMKAVGIFKPHSGVKEVEFNENVKEFCKGVISIFDLTGSTFKIDKVEIDNYNDNDLEMLKRDFEIIAYDFNNSIKVFSSGNKQIASRWQGGRKDRLLPDKSIANGSNCLD